MSLCLLLTSKLSLGSQLGRDGEDAKGGQRGLSMRHGDGGGNKAIAEERRVPGLRLEERMRARSGREPLKSPLRLGTYKV